MNNVAILPCDTPLRITEPVNAENETRIHRGGMVELMVRRSHLGLSEISRKLEVSRQTLYNWFKNENLSVGDIIKIGAIIEYDFSKDIPAVLSDNGPFVLKNREAGPLPAENQTQAMYYWMEKYIRLLEQYNEILYCKT